MKKGGKKHGVLNHKREREEKRSKPTEEKQPLNA